MKYRRIRENFRNVLLSPLQKRKDRELFLNAMNNSAWSIVKEKIQRYPEAVHWRDESGATALHWAATYRSAGMIEYLLDLGADIEAKDKRGVRPLHHAAQCAGDTPTEALEALLKRGAEIEARDANGNTPLLHACLRNKPWNVEVLMLAGADENAANNTGNTPLKEVTSARGVNAVLYNALVGAREERKRRAEQRERDAAEQQRQTIIQAALNGISNGLDSNLTVLKPVRLK